MLRILTWAGAFVCLCGTLCRADQACGETAHQTTFDCVYRGCSESVTVETPFGERVDFFKCGYVSCCQQLFTTCYDLGLPCTQIKDPAVRERVAQVAAGSRVLVADCRGRYVLYEPQADWGRTRHTVLADEHALR
jgi:hypothetical protein